MILRYSDTLLCENISIEG